MARLFKLVLLFSTLLITGCSGSSGSSGTAVMAIETCYDVEVTNAGNQQTQNICTTSENGGYNGLGVSRFIKFTAATSTTVSVRVTRTSGLNPSDPDIYLLKNGLLINLAETTQVNTEFLTSSVTAGEYVVEINEYGYWNSSLKVKANSFVAQKTSEPVLVQATAPSNCVATPSTVTGTVTFDRVPNVGGLLNYANTTQEPIQQAVIEVICNGGAYSTGFTDQNGDYTLSYPNNMSSFVRVNAEMLNASMNFTVVDNTISSQPIYVMDDDQNPLLTSGNVTRSFNADSGWGTTSYTGPRVAAPFAILDSIRKAKDKVVTAAAPSPVVFPALKINWSPSNTTLSITTSHYDGTQIFLLGAENSDTDEYDEHVIIHEWGHYFEFNFSRTDSIGGPHTRGDILDIRVAFGEGFGNAFSAMVTGRPVYIDTSGSQQQSGFSIDIEANNCTNAGWFSECSIQSALYDFYDTSNDGVDSLNLGFTPIYNVLVGSQKTTPAFTSIFSFTNEFKLQNASSANAIDSILNAQKIDSIMDIYGSSQITSNPGATNQLPVYGTY